VPYAEEGFGIVDSTSAADAAHCIRDERECPTWESRIDDHLLHAMSDAAKALTST